MFYKLSYLSSMFRFLFDVLVYLTNNYSMMPESFRSRFQEKDLVNARLGVDDIVTCDKDFKDYE